MKHIYLNLKRFDVPVALGGVNRLSNIRNWGNYIIRNTEESLATYDLKKVEFIDFFPEMHLLSALSACSAQSPVSIGCQGVYFHDISTNGNFGAFTTERPAAAMKAAGITYVLIGHCEERNKLNEILSQAGVNNSDVVNRILHDEICCAVNQGLKVLYCIGEKSEEQAEWEEVLGMQIHEGLHDIDCRNIVIGYEPVWSIGPGKKSADKNYITKVAKFVKAEANGIDIVYGGGLKSDNAEMLATIPEIDGGLIALTRFQGEIGFYPNEYLKIIKLYLGN